jgi:hypothetical protein
MKRHMKCDIVCQAITLPNHPFGQAISLLQTHMVDYTQLHIKQSFGTKLYVIRYSPYSTQTTGLHHEWGTEYPPRWMV